MHRNRHSNKKYIIHVISLWISKWKAIVKIKLDLRKSSCGDCCLPRADEEKAAKKWIVSPANCIQLKVACVCVLCTGLLHSIGGSQFYRYFPNSVIHWPEISLCSFMRWTFFSFRLLDWAWISFIHCSGLHATHRSFTNCWFGFWFTEIVCMAAATTQTIPTRHSAACSRCIA